MRLLQKAKKLSWVTAHPGYRTHAWRLPMRIVRWEWCRMKGNPVRLPLFDFTIEARPTDGVGRVICYFREQADLLFAFMNHYLKPGMTVIDVGANIGSHTIYAARLVTDQGQVFSFEADPDTFSLLQDNVRLNHIENATLSNLCVSDQVGTVSFNVNADSARSSLLRKGAFQRILPASTLDKLLPSGLQADLLKIDVEGADYLVLGGAKRLFEMAPPQVVVIEVSSREREIRDFLWSYGYRLYRFDSRSLAFRELEWPTFNTYAVRDGIQAELSVFTFSSLPAWKQPATPIGVRSSFSFFAHDQV